MIPSPLVITAGEPAGIGPDLCVAIAAHVDLPQLVVIGDALLLRERAALLDAEISVTTIDEQSATERASLPGELRVVDIPFPVKVSCGNADPANARTLLDGLDRAVNGCQQGLYSGLVTAPVSKRVINDAGIKFTGHTEFLAELTGCPLPVMLLVAGDLRVALATTHMPLRQVPDALTQDGLRRVLKILHEDLVSRFGIEAPRIIVCGLNPHAGEGGVLGREDAEIIAPVIDALRHDGLHVDGPLPADTAFTPAAGPCDAVLAMYHDQGLPVLKFAGFGHAVNITLGLPIIRTSVDHGTAFDIAGSGKADPGSLIAAIKLAASLTCQA